jgi:hypothetical protein
MQRINIVPVMQKEAGNAAFGEKPVVTKPEVTKPPAAKPPATKPTAAKPPVTKPEVAKPAVTIFNFIPLVWEKTVSAAKEWSNMIYTIIKKEEPVP